MRTRGQSFRLLGAACLLLPAAQQAPAQEPRVAMVGQAEIVFLGTVIGVGAASFPGVPVSQQTLVVRVDGVLDKPAAVKLGAGDSVTVEARTAGSLRQGLQATFYTTGWIYGQGLAVREVGHEAVAGQLSAGAVSQQRDSMLQVRRQVSDTQLRARIRAADMVVVGQVETIRPATLTALAPRPVPEHDPQWQEAIVLVESSIKGSQAGQRVVVRFPGSMDVAWYAMPRFAVAQQGTFLLRLDTISGTPKAMVAGREVPAYTVVSKQDLLSTQDAARVQALSRP